MISQGITREKGAHLYAALGSVLHMKRTTAVYTANAKLRDMLEAAGFTNIPSQREYHTLQRSVRDYATDLTVVLCESFNVAENLLVENGKKETPVDRRNEKLPRITIATDASMGIDKGEVAGFSWVCEDGRSSAGWVRVGINEVMAAEIWAIYDVLRSFSRKRKLLINSDSRYGIRAIMNRKAILKKGQQNSTAELLALEAVDNLLEGRDVIFGWVKAHDGHTLNETADKMARHVRRAYEDELPDSEKWSGIDRIVLEGIGFDNKRKMFVEGFSEVVA